MQTVKPSLYLRNIFIHNQLKTEIHHNKSSTELELDLPGMKSKEMSKLKTMIVRIICSTLFTYKNQNFESYGHGKDI